MRQRAAAERREGPRIAVCGAPTAGKTTLCRTLASYATRVGAQPIVVNTDPKEGMLSLPGTLSAAVVGSVLDVEAVDGWGTTPTSGPSQVPVKLPLVYYYGHARAEEDPRKYKQLVSKMAATVTSRFAQDPEAKSAGMIIDTFGISEKSTSGLDSFAHVVEELSGMQRRDVTRGVLWIELTAPSEHHHCVGIGYVECRGPQEVCVREDEPGRAVQHCAPRKV